MSYSLNDLIEKIQLLAVYEGQIPELEKQLQETRKLCNQLKEELHDYRIDTESGLDGPSRNSIGTTAVGINRLPNETLLQVFEYSLADNHRLIRRLLPVCKRWHFIVMQSKWLWARIQLSPGDYTGYQDSPRFLTRYIEACLQHSQPLLLDVDIDYNYLRTREEYIRDRIQDTISSIIGNDDDDVILDWTLCLDCDFPCAEYDQYVEGWMGDLETLLGPLGTNMERWRTLELCVPWREPSLAFEIWCKFYGSTPNLESISLVQIEVTLDSIEMVEGDYPAIFPELPALRSLTFSDSAANTFLQHLPIPTSNLLHIDIYYDESLDGLPLLPLFAALRTLTLRTRVTTPNEEDIESKDAILLIRLPALQELSLYGESRVLMKVGFDLPNLQQLFVCIHQSTYVPSTISTRRFHWSIQNPEDEFWTPMAVESALETMIRSYSQAEEVIVDEFAIPYVAKVLAGLQRTSTLPSSLRTLVVNHADGRRECLITAKAL